MNDEQHTREIAGNNIESTTPVRYPLFYNPYEDTISHGIPPIPPPPPRAKRNWGRSIAVIGLVLLLVVALGITGLVSYYVGKTTGASGSTPTPHRSSPVLFQTPTHLQQTPTSQPTIAVETPTSNVGATTVTADELYNAFIASSISATNPIEMDTSFWQCCSYYPAHGSVQFTETVDNNTLIIAVFNNAHDASLVAAQQQWAAQYIQVDMCLLLSLEGPPDISYYKPVMQRYCV